MAAPEPVRPAAPKRSPVPLIIVGILAAAAAVWAVRGWLHARTYVSTDNAQVDGHITLIAPKVQAFVGRVLVDDNVRVQAGDTLVTLDDRDLRVRVAQVEADLAMARTAAGSAGRPGQLPAQLRAAQAQVGGADANVRMAQAMLGKADADLARLTGLAAKQIIAAQQLDAARAAREAAAASVTAAQREAAAAVSMVAAGGAAVAGGEARVVAAQAAVAAAKLQLQYTVLTAPMAGTIARRSVEPGALVQIGQSLMSIVPDSALWVTANLKETQLTDVRVGQPATFTVDAYPGRRFEGTVVSLSPATGARFALLPPDNATGNFTKVVQRIPVRIAIAAADPATPLRPGMSVELEIKVR